MTTEFVEIRPGFFITQSPVEATNNAIIITGKQATLIDPGVTPDEIAAIGTFVQEHGATVETIFLTHSHWDHMLGVDHFPGAHMIAHHLYAEAVAMEERGLRASLATWEHEAGIIRERPFVIPQPSELIEEHQASFLVGDQEIITIHTPGHHRDLFVLYGYDGVLWASDMLSDIEIPFVEHNIAAYRVSLDELSNIPNVRIVVPGHGAWTSDQNEIRDRIERDRTYLATLEELVKDSLAQELTVEQTIERCMAIPIINPSYNTGAHRANIEMAWLEWGGTGDSSKIGWGKYYPR